MTPKVEFINALEHNKISESIPIWELEFHLWDKFNFGKFTVGNDFVQLSGAEKEFALHENADTVAQVCELLHFSAVTIPGGYWEVSPGIPAFFWLPDEYRLKQASILKEKIGNTVALVANTGGVMAMPEGDNFVDFSIQIFEDPASIDALAKSINADSLERIDLFADLGMDIFLTASDLADSHNLYFSPEQLDRFIYPYLSKWADYIREKGFHSILHTDGNINTALSRIAASGVNGIQALDTNAKMDILQTQSLYSDKLCVCGNIDCGVMITASKEVIHEKTKQLLLSAKERGSFVLGASNALEYITPAENYMEMINTWKMYGLKN